MKSFSKQDGALLIEAMVAVAVFSIALLSLAGAQLNASKSTFSALLKTESAVRSSEIIDQMRLNLTGVLAGDYNLSYNATLPQSPSSQGGVDVKNWLDGIQQDALKGTAADAQITCAGLACTIELRWDNTRAAGNTAVAPQFIYTTDVNL